MNTGIFFLVMTISLLFISAVIAGCSSAAPSVRGLSPLLISTPGENTHALAIGETAIVSSHAGRLEVTVRSFNATTGKILIEEKNNGTETFQYNPKLWLQDGEGVTYTTVYCHADPCPGYVFLTTLPPQSTEQRDLDNIYASFHVPERESPGLLLLFWSNDEQENSWIIIPAKP
ncbi:MAG: hypothetical protein WAW33_03025 [Minisyncoccia bacterium]